jgi:hypothetical protein
VMLRLYSSRVKESHPKAGLFVLTTDVPSTERDLVPTNDRKGQAGLFTETRKLLL